MHAAKQPFSTDLDPARVSVRVVIQTRSSAIPSAVGQTSYLSISLGHAREDAGK